MQVNVSRLMLRLMHHVNPRTRDLGLPFSVRRGSRVALEEAPEGARGRGKISNIVAPRTKRDAGQWEPDLAAPVIGCSCLCY